MKFISNGLLYDSETATEIKVRNYTYHGVTRREALCKTKNNRWFVYTTGESVSPMLEPITEEEAKLQLAPNILLYMQHFPLEDA